MTLSTLSALSGISLLLTAIVFRLLLFFKIKKELSYGLSVIVFVVSFLPLSGYSLNEYIRGVINDLSITTLILLFLYLVKPDREKTENQPVFFTIVIAGLIFYPIALGLGPLDPYAGGYINNVHGLLAPVLLLSFLAILMLYAFIKDYLILLFCLTASTLAFQLSLMESNNLWDYLFDPVIFFYALFALIFRRIGKVFKNKKEFS